MDGLFVAGSYAVYAAQHIAMMNWFPTYLADVYGTGVMLSAAVPALVLTANAVGNYTAAWAMRCGHPIWLLMAIGASGMAIMEVGMFLDSSPDTLKFLFALGFGAAGGLIPASALAAAPMYAPTPAQIGIMSGLMVTATNTGQLFGPPALAVAREQVGTWEGTLWLLLGLATIGLVFALLSRSMECRVTQQSI